MNATQQARLAVSSVLRGTPVQKVIREQLSGLEDQVSLCVGDTEAGCKSRLTELGLTEAPEAGKDFPGGKVAVFTAPNPEDPATTSRVYMGYADGKCVGFANDAVANLPPEQLASMLGNLAARWGLMTPPGAPAAPGSAPQA